HRRFGIAVIDDQGNFYAQSGGAAGHPARHYLSAPVIDQLIQLAKTRSPDSSSLLTVEKIKFVVKPVAASPLIVVALGEVRADYPLGLFFDQGLLPELIPILILMLMATLILWRYHSTRRFRHNLEERVRIRREAGSLTGVVYSWDMLGGQVKIWGDFEQTLGYRVGELNTTTCDWLDVVVHEDRDRVIRTFEQYFANAAAFEFEFRVNRKDGTTRIWRTSGKPMTLAPAGRPSICGVILDVTDMRKTEQIIRDREEYLNAVTEASVDGMVTIDSQGTIRTVNTATLKIFGYDRDDLVGENVRILMPEQYLAGHDQYLRDYVDTGVRKAIGLGREIEGRRKDGAIFPLEVSVSEFTLTTGEHQFLGTLRDLSERKAAESAQLRFGRIVESVSNEIYVIDSQTYRLTMTNNSALSNLGYPSQDAEHLTLLDIMPSFTLKTVKALLLPLRSGERLEIGLQTQLRRKDGTQYDVEMILQYLEHETPPVFVFTATDVSERNERARRLRESEEGLKHIVDELHDHAILTLNAEGNIKAASSGAETVFRYQPAELIGKPMSIFYLDEDRRNGEAWHALEGARLTGRFSQVGRRLTKDGQEIWVDTSLSALKNTSGAVVGFIKIARDITERRQRDEKLYQSQKMEAIGQLTGGIAHDFNNLLAVVIGNLALLEERTLDEEILDMLDAPLRAARRGAELTQRLLAFARRQTLNPEVIDLRKSIKKTALLLKRVLGGNVSVHVDAIEGECLAIADETQLESAILNLALNARDAMSGGGVLTIGAAVIDIEAETAEIRGDISPGPYVEISLTDTGVGMSPDLVARVFEPFFTTKETGRGTGLGLSMVYGFAQQSRGGVTIKSEPDVGTTVRLYLPRAASMPVRIEGIDNELANEAMNIRVLLVEDDDMVRMSVKRQLQKLGCQVTEAGNGTAGLDQLRKNVPFDLLLSDIVMPGGINGLELARRCQEERSDVKIVLMTGYADPAAVLGDGGISKFPIVSKPFDRRELRRAIRESLTGLAR
ncbi:MAG: domain S-box protein, partial [Rhodospirillales bacterium]|nr:domain S-box protein [Rhodospirillales bacterium]